MEIKILESAKQDLLSGYSFYESKRKGLGNYFINSLFADIESLILYAGVHQKFFGFYRMLSRRFPYAIYYKFKKDRNEVIIYAVLDCRRNPKKLEKRLKS